MTTYRVYVCHGDSCKRGGAQAVWQALRNELQHQQAEEAASLIVAGCQGRCDDGPNLTVHPGATKYSGVMPAHVSAIVRDHLLHGVIVEEILFRGW
jgi:(2Fe-2S) ferredoxin